MTANRPAERASDTGGGPSIHVLRARRLLYGGLVGGVGAAALCLVGFGLASGAVGLRSAGLAAAMVLFFYIGGQYVMVLFADAGARLLLLVSMGSYTMRVLVLGLVLFAYGLNRDKWPAFDPMAVFITTIAVVAGWLLVEVAVFFRLRISAYDTEYVTPTHTDSDQ